jgi:putative tryptophan/tyrosine transport system substrate-binding protein
MQRALRSKSKRGKRICQIFVLVCLLSAVLLPTDSVAQQARKPPRIGYQSDSSLSLITERIEAFRHGLREFGYVEGKNILVEYRYAEGKLDRRNELTAELVRLNVEVIVTGGPTVTRSVKEATSIIPVLMAQDSDPVGNGFVASLARPGGNITGLSNITPEIYGKRLELLKETVPTLSRLAVLGNSTVPANAQALKETEIAARALGIQLQYLEARDPKDIVSAFRAVSNGRADAILALASPVFTSQRKQLIDLAVKNRLPAVYARPEIVEEGGLMTYGVSINDLYRRAVIYVDKILKGAKPADLPVEQPTKFELIINLKTAKQIGLTIPPNVLARADKVIR